MLSTVFLNKGKGMKNILSVLVLSTIFLTGCEVIGPRLKVEPPKIKVDGIEVEGSQKHCPPGQAKKGNC